MGVRDLDLVGLLAGELLVVLVADDDGATLAGDDLLVGVEGLGEDGVTGEVLLGMSDNGRSRHSI